MDTIRPCFGIRDVAGDVLGVLIRGIDLVFSAHDNEGRSFYARKLGALRADDVRSPDDFARLPFTTKAELAADHQEIAAAFGV